MYRIPRAHHRPDRYPTPTHLLVVPPYSLSHLQIPINKSQSNLLLHPSNHRP